MATRDTINSDLYVNGQCVLRSVTLPNSCVGNANVEASAGISASKLEHRHSIEHSQTGNVASTNIYVGPIRGATGELLTLEAALTETLPDGDRTVTIDLHLGDASNSFATVLSGTIVLDSSSALRTLESAVISAADLEDGDILKIVVTVAGSSGTQPAGLACRLVFDEDAN